MIKKVMKTSTIRGKVNKRKKNITMETNNAKFMDIRYDNKDINKDEKLD